MNSNDKKIVWIVGICCVSFVVLLLSAFSLHNQRVKIYVENDYTQQTLQGDTCAHWIKSEAK